MGAIQPKFAASLRHGERSEAIQPLRKPAGAASEPAPPTSPAPITQRLDAFASLAMTAA